MTLVPGESITQAADPICVLPFGTLVVGLCGRN